MAMEVIRTEQNQVRTGVRVNWGSIFFGAFVTTAVSCLAVLLGNAIGLAPGNIVDPTASGALRVWSWIYTLVTLVIAFGIGGYSIRVGRIDDGRLAPLYGLGTWAVAGVFMLAYGLSLATLPRQVFQGAGSNGANWLALCVAFFGAIAAVSGGRSAATGVAVTTEVKPRERQEMRHAG